MRNIPEVKKIATTLEKLQWSGKSHSQITLDFISWCHALLTEVPAQTRAMMTGQVHTIRPENEETIKKLGREYGKEVSFFDDALYLLFDATEKEPYRDAIGDYFMLYGNPNTKAGQYFTPHEAAYMMSAMIVGSEGELDKRLNEAVAKSEIATAHMLSMELVKDGLKGAWLVSHVLPYIIPHFEPITVIDHACGSGVLLLAAAGHFPDYAVKMGLVQFYGIDIDPICTKMAQINIVLHGLNGTGSLAYWNQAELVIKQQRQVDEFLNLIDPSRRPAVPPHTPTTTPPAHLVPAEFDPKNYQQQKFDFTLPQKDEK